MQKFLSATGLEFGVLFATETFIALYAIEPESFVRGYFLQLFVSGKFLSAKGFSQSQLLLAGQMLMTG